MIDGNISMEEDTELRDLVVQTLENNGVLAKVRAELRASVFLTLEEQESVLNPEPFLNKSIKQYLANSEGKLLFSLVREFLEYFGLDYTISVFEPETYFGKEYNYVGRKKLSEELGINSSEPLLGEILKNTINGALNNTQKNDSSNIKLSNTSGAAENVGNATFDISVPKMLHKDEQESISIDTSEKLESLSNSNVQVPINVTITDKKQNQYSINNKKPNSLDMSDSNSNESNNKNLQNINDKSITLETATDQSNKVLSETDINVNHSKLISSQPEIQKNPETNKSKKSMMEFQAVKNVKNTKQIDPMNNVGKTVFFDQMIVDGKQEKITEPKNDKTLLGELPPLSSTNNSIFGDLPPLNGKKANINDLKELMDIAQGVSQYDDDFPSSASGSANEQSPSKAIDKSEHHLKVQISELESLQNLQSENESEEIDEEIPSSISGVDNIAEKNSENLSISAAVHSE
ncbi:Fgfr1 oncogene partner [Nasonia vitripennis]|uniref:FGFR1 oncogene partner (FOP) N-terminal dimerisation domain-containing protein n=1 Tax=Nasonia vitripennis TaxID=7425 RepID=A0A7M6UEZ0_NASVI|nr:Fgfr1 oncogene partner [Nasonia vitripennis]